MLGGLIACVRLILFRRTRQRLGLDAELNAATAQHSCTTWDAGEGMWTHHEVSCEKGANEWCAEYFPVGRTNHASVSDGRRGSDRLHASVSDSHPEWLSNSDRRHSLDRIFIGYNKTANKPEAIFAAGRTSQDSGSGGFTKRFVP